ncbi:hypothetical protein [Limisphaera sp. VF-2]|jgi:hypothetical protein|uniref:hypothetical protein n=1 Tax=Limisphaera sp. VF-2 TaxID=3400418 RepID=UPI001756CB72
MKQTKGQANDPRPAWRKVGGATALLLACLVVTGCRREEVQVYRVEKEGTGTSGPTAATSAQTPPMAGHPHGDFGGPKPRLKYSVPEGWTEQPLSAMRAASFRVGDGSGPHADVGVIPLRGLTGRDLEMWNLWRQQLGLAEGTEAEMIQAAIPVTIGGARGKLFDLVAEEPPHAGADKVRILAAMVDVGDVGWFFKMTGPDALVRSQKETFVAWLQSVEFLPEEAPATEPAAVASEGTPRWNVPSHWRSAPAGQFLVAKYLVGEGEGQADVNVSQSAGEGGGWVSNVNRWRRQVGLEEASQEQIREATVALEVGSGQAMQIELTGTDVRTGRPARVVGIMVPRPERAWFYKLMGPPETVEREKAAFLEFVRSARY